MRRFLAGAVTAVVVTAAITACGPDGEGAAVAAMVERSSVALTEAAERYAADDNAGSLQGVVGDVSAEQGEFIHLVNLAAIAAAPDETAEDEARRAANDRVADGRIRAGLLAWDALRAAEVTSGRDDLLSEEQRTIWREVAGDDPGAPLTPYADLTDGERRELGGSRIDVLVSDGAGGNWGDHAEDAFARSVR